MTFKPVHNIVIVGGGTAGWMTAAALSKVLGRAYNIRVVESDEIGIIGVGEATIPHIADFNRALEIDEDEFLRATQGTFKLGIEFVNWGRVGDRYIHGFGRLGQATDALPFHHFWLRLASLGRAAPLAAYSINTAAPQHAKFMRARKDMPGSPVADISNAFHFDAGLYARFLRAFAEKLGVVRTEGKIARVTQREPDGFIEAVALESGERIAGDFFIDCSGMRGLLIEQTLKSGFDDWSQWLPCDRALAVPCASAGPLLPVTRSTAHSAGWQWRIPLQHRTGNGHIYCSNFMGQDEATAILMKNLDGAPLAEPRPLKFATGRRKQFWNRNCVAVGLSSGFLEPLESTSIYLIQRAIIRLVQLFPGAGISTADIDEFNQQTRSDIEHIRDFIVLHYRVTNRQDSPYWQACRNMDIPASLRHRIDLFRETGRVFRVAGELFAENSWIQVMLGQGIVPRQHHQVADLMGDAELARFLGGIRSSVDQAVLQLPPHQAYFEKYCSSSRA